MITYVGEEEARLLVQNLKRHQPLAHCDIEGLAKLTEDLARTVVPEGEADNIHLQFSPIIAADREQHYQYKVSFGRLIDNSQIQYDALLKSNSKKPFTPSDRDYFESLMPRLRSSRFVVDVIKGSDQRFSLLAKLRCTGSYGRSITRPLLVARYAHNQMVSRWEYMHEQRTGLSMAIPVLRSYLG